MTVNNAADGTAPRDRPDDGTGRDNADRDDDLHRPNRWNDQRRRHDRRPGRLDHAPQLGAGAAVTGRRRHDLRRRPDDHRRQPLAQRGTDRHHHVRRRDRNNDCRHRELDDEAEVTAGRASSTSPSQPSVTVNNAVDGTGTNTVTPLTTFANTATTETFTYTAPTGGMTNGPISVDVRRAGQHRRPASAPARSFRAPAPSRLRARRPRSAACRSMPAQR